MSGQDTRGRPPQKALVRVWSPVIRIGHWALVTAFAIAYLTEDDLLTVHTWAGYVAAGAVLVRLVWGIIGPEQDRLSHFLYPPREVLSYLGDALRLRSKRYLRHSPAGAVMGLALLVSMATTAGTGMVLLAQTKNAGPLAPWFGQSAGLNLVAPAYADDADHHGGHGFRGEGREGDESPMEEVHEFFANLTLVLILLHVTGVALASLSHRENLVRSMITGSKPADEA
ncbi:MAG: cytochrome b/b6 domain-containing protein [Rhodopila sp.]